MRSLRSGRAALHTLTVFAATAICPAQLTMYTSRSAWQAAATGITTIDFGTAAPPPRGSYTAYPSPPGLTLSGVSFSTTKPGTSLASVSQFYCCPTYARSFDSLATPYDGTGMQVTLNNNATAVGFDLFTVVSGNMGGTNRDQVDVTIGGQKLTVNTPAAPALAFIGFVLTSPISSLTIIPRQVNGQTQVDVVNFSFGSATPSAGTTPTAIVLQSSGTPAQLSQSVTLTATVTPPAASGAVTFYDGVTLLGVSSLLAGKATLMTSLLEPGVHSLHAYYRGDPIYSASVSQPLPQMVASLGQNGFQPRVSTGGVSFPRSLATADFNNDGIPDLAVADFDIDKVSILLGKGDGTFRSAVNLSLGTGRGPRWIATGDFDGDGRTDLAVASGASNSVTVLFGNGDGTFKPPVNYSVGAAPQAVAIADFNGDGIADLATVNYSANNVSILLGNADGTFRGASNFSGALSGPLSMTAGDFNGDGKPDLAVANSTGGSVSILLGNGDGTFKSAAAVPVGQSPVYVVTGDLNADGIADLAVTNGASDQIGVLLGNGDGTFQAQVNYSAPKGLQAITVGDFNGDGVPDLAAVDAITAALSILTGNGDGTFKSAVTYDAGPQAATLVVGDFNGDGRPDVAVGNDTTTNISLLLGAPVEADLTITESHDNDFTQGQAGAIYNIAVRNLGPGSSSGTVTVVDTLPAALTATAIGGDGWNCSLSNLTCTRRDALAAGGAYPPVAVTVNVAADAPATVTNTATVSGGGDSNPSNNTAVDPTNITTGLTITTMSPDPGSPGMAYSFTLTATGGTPPYAWSIASGELPDGLVLAADSGIISGIPTTPGDATFVVSVTDAAGATASQMLTLTIAAADRR